MANVLRFQAKLPGPQMHLQAVEIRFSYQETFAAGPPNAYDTLLWDVIKNDPTLFMRTDQIEASWRLLMPVLEAWAAAPPGPLPQLCCRHLGTGGCRGPVHRPRTELAPPHGIGTRLSAS